MNYGRFFKLNNRKSDLSRGITSYDYIWLCDNENNKDSSKFPIYLTISKDSIDFHAHCHDDHIDFNGKHIHKHSHNTILSLPLSANLDAKDGLTDALVEGWETNFPRYAKEESNYLFETLCNVILKIEKDWDKSLSYSNLPNFNDTIVPKIQQCKSDEIITFLPNDELKWIDYSKNIKIFIDEIRNKSIKKHFGRLDKHNRFFFDRIIRKLILDFMFDLEHTKIFQTSLHYEHISIKLKENYFFSALVAKANFYYWREIIIQEKEKEIKTDDITDQLSVYIEYYLKAEKQWTKYIRSPKAQTNFNFKDEWLEYPEEEMDRIYGKEFFKEVDKIVKLYLSNRDKQKEEIYKCRNKSSKWLIWHYEWKWCQFFSDGFFGLHLFFPKLIASVITAWVTVIIGSSLLLPTNDVPEDLRLEGLQREFRFSRYWEIKTLIDDIPSGILQEIVQRVILGYWAIVIAAFILTMPTIFLVIDYSILNRSPYIWKNNKCRFFILRPFKICFLSFIVSLIIGILLFITFGSTSLAFLERGVPNPYFWLCVFLAMFIGVVLQQVTTEKYTEE